MEIVVAAERAAGWAAGSAGLVGLAVGLRGVFVGAGKAKVVVMAVVMAAVAMEVEMAGDAVAAGTGARTVEGRAVAVMEVEKAVATVEAVQVVVRAAVKVAEEMAAVKVGKKAVRVVVVAWRVAGARVATLEGCLAAVKMAAGQVVRMVVATVEVAAASRVAAREDLTVV
jgi:hypothetical protein